MELIELFVMQTKTVQTVGFVAVLGLFLILVVAMLWPYFQLLALAGILAFLFLPVHNFFLRKLKNESWAAFLTVVFISTIVAVPLYFLTKAVIGEMVGFYGQYKGGAVHIDKQLLVNRLPPAWQEKAISLLSDASGKIGIWIQSLTSDIAGLLSNIAGFLFSSFLLFFSIFYFLKDNARIKEQLGGLFPLSASQQSLFTDKLIGAVNGMVRGSFLLALMQGAAAMIGFWLAGIPQPLFWGLVTVIASFIPTVGSSLVIIPAILYLLLFKSYVAAIILAGWFIVVHLPLDNMVTPKIIGAQTQLHPLLVLLSVLGGLAFFGFLGVLFGPIIMAIFVALVGAYRTSYRSS